MMSVRSLDDSQLESNREVYMYADERETIGARVCPHGVYKLAARSCTPTLRRDMLDLAYTVSIREKLLNCFRCPAGNIVLLLSVRVSLCNPHLAWTYLFQLLDLIVGTLHYLMVPMGEAQLLKLFDFNTTLALRFLEASAEDMQLWGCNQMGAILALTQRHCWSPKAVSVKSWST